MPRAMDGLQHLVSEFAQGLAANIGQAWLQPDSPGVAMYRNELIHSACLSEGAGAAGEFSLQGRAGRHERAKFGLVGWLSPRQVSVPK